MDTKIILFVDFMFIMTTYIVIVDSSIFHTMTCFARVQGKVHCWVPIKILLYNLLFDQKPLVFIMPCV